MQPTIKSPSHYDWSGFQRQPRGFIKKWCRGHEVSFQTTYQLIRGLYVGGSGPRISNIIQIALTEGLIQETPSKEAA